MRGRVNRTWMDSGERWVWGLGFLIWGGFLWGLWRGVEGDVSRLIVAGDRYTEAGTLPYPIFVRQNSDGYDGQFNYRLALEPWTNQINDYGIELDKPIIRQRRIGYPLLSWLFSGGDKEAVTWSMVGVNVAGLGVLGMVAYLLLRDRRDKWIWWCLLMGAPGLILALSRNLADIWVLVWLGVLIYTKRQKKYGWMAVSLVMGLLFKETLIVVGGAWVGVRGWKWLSGQRLKAKNKKREILEMVGVVVAIGVFLGFHWFLVNKWGAGPSTYLTESLGMPLQGIKALVDKMANNPEIQLVYMGELGLMGMIGYGALRSMGRSRTEMEVKVAFVIWSVWGVWMNEKVWIEDWSFMRVMLEWWWLGLLVMMGDEEHKGRGLLGVNVVVWLLLARDVLESRL